MNSKGGPKVAALVINAIRRLQDVQGSTMKEINNYIAQEYNIPNKDIRKQVQVALRRGLSYGILQRAKGGYYVCNKLSPTNALSDVQDESTFCCKNFGKKKRKPKAKKSSCRSASRRRSRSRKAACGPKKKPRRRSIKRKCATRRSRSRSKKRTVKAKRSCKPVRRSRSMKRRKTRSQSRRRCPPKKPRKCAEVDMNKSENQKGGNNVSNTSMISGTNPERQASSNKCPDED